MGRTRHNMCVFQWVVQQSCGNQTGRMRHIDHEDGADLIRYAADTCIIPLATVGTCPCYNQLGLVRTCFYLQIVVINTPRSFLQIIAYCVEHQTAEVNSRTVTEVTSMTEVETHKRVAGFETCHKDRHVRLRAAMGLDINVLCIVEFFQTFTGDIFRNIHHLASPVIAMSGITLCILVGQHAAHRFHHLVAYKILAGNQFDAFCLTFTLLTNHVKNLSVSIHTM